MPRDSTSPVKEYEAKREGRQEVVVTHSTDEAGEPDRRDPGEGRGHRNKEPTEGNMMGTEEPKDLAEIEEVVSTKQRRIAENAKRLPEVSFSSLAYHMDVWWLYEAYRRTRKDGAVGIDGQTAEEYQRDLKRNLENLNERAKSGLYRAPAVRRVHIPKPGSAETRPIGIPTFEDKVLQRAVVMLIEPVYEQDFHDISYGFRPGKSQHQALRSVRDGLMKNRGGWVIDLDIRKFFDTLNHGKPRQILAKRVSDGVIRRLVGKWLQAGVMENGELTHNVCHEKRWALLNI